MRMWTREPPTWQLILHGFLFAFFLVKAEAVVKVNNKTAAQTFNDPKVAALADAPAKGDTKEVDRLIKAPGNIA